MGKRGRHLKAVKGLKPSEVIRDEASAVSELGNTETGPACKHCHGRRVVKDRRGVVCICVPCFLREPISRSAER